MAFSYRLAKSETVLITGGAGYIGGHAVLAFLDRGEIPVVLDDSSTGSRSAIPSEATIYLRRRWRYFAIASNY
jgi:UDP-glucose 4-epimerase